MNRAAAALVVALAAAPPIAGQSVAAGRAGPRAELEPDVEARLARSAAPPTVSADATVLLWKDGGFVVGAKGTNGVTCYVARSWPESLEPHCFDRRARARSSRCTSSRWSSCTRAAPRRRSTRRWRRSCGRGSSAFRRVR